MKIQELLDEFYDSTGTVSGLTRQLAFAGIAIIWVLRVGDGTGDVNFSERLMLPLYYFVIGLALDFSQYLYKTITYGLLNWHHWRIHRSNEADVNVSGFANFPSHLFFFGKVAVIGYAYLLLLCYLHGQLAPGTAA